jgi:inositol polyphosphate 1-phosphatase
VSASWHGINYPYSFQGEESAEFTNTLGENIRVRVCSSIEETSQLLSRVLDGRQSAADLLAKEVHSENSYYGVGHELIDQVPEDQFNVDNLGIWIDPIGETTKRPKDFFSKLILQNGFANFYFKNIYFRCLISHYSTCIRFRFLADGTNNYIRGGTPVDGDIDYSDTFQTRGLPVVTVLIGVFDRNTGKPVAGVVNQPFVKFDHKENK